MVLTKENCPKGWEICKVENVLTINAQSLSNTTAPDYPITYLSIEEVDTQRIDYDAAVKTTFSEAPGRARRLLNDGDLLFSTVRPNLKSFAVFRKPNEDNWVASTGFAVASAKGDEEALFFFYQLLSSIGERQIHALVVGSNYPAINESDFRNLKVYRPPLAEQRAIAAILTRVDKAIEATEASIRAAERLKRALMQNLLTGKLKPDGTWRTDAEFYTDEKLGKVPVGWEVIKGWQITSLITKGQSPKWQGFDYQQEGMLFITSENVRDGVLDLENRKYLPIEFNEKIKNSQLTTGDILINIVGASIGRSCLFISTGEIANINQAVCLIRPSENYDSRFISYYLQFPKTVDRLLGNQVETARANLSLGDLRHLKYCIPSSLQEQKLIAQKADSVNSIIQGKQAKIAKLQRLKKSLMQHLLTGKVRVDVARVEAVLAESEAVAA